MSQRVASQISADHEHISWVRTRMTLDAELMEWIRHGFSLIAVGFGSFSFLDGMRGTLGEGAGANVTEPSRMFSLAITAIGILLIALALRHNKRMVAFVNADEYGEGKVLSLPDERREEYLALAAIVIGVISFVALLFLL